MSNIINYGVSIPRFRIENTVLNPKRGKGKRAIIFSDEDIITLAYDAACKCLESEIERSNTNIVELGIDAVLFATTIPVFKNRYHASFLADLLGLPSGILAMDITASPRAGSDALLLADQLLNTNNYNKILVLAADTYFPPIGDELIPTRREGHAGCALLLGKETGIASIRISKSYSSAIAEEFIYKDSAIQLDSRFSRDAGFMSSIHLSLKDYLGNNEIKPDAFNAVILNSLYAKSAVGLFKKIGFDVEKQLFLDKIQNQIGSTGVCHSLLLLIHSLQKNSGNILLLDYYNGTNIFHIEQTGQISTNARTIDEQINNFAMIESYQDYLILERAGNILSTCRKKQEIFSSDMMLEREKENIIRLNGFECTQCGTVYFIKAQHCNKCGGEEYSSKKLSKQGIIFTFTKEYYFPSSFPPVTMAVIDLDRGGRMTLQVTDEMYKDEMEETLIGQRVKLVLRKMIENDVKPNYFWKCKLIN